MNEKAGMNAFEFDKHITNSMLPLFPDAEDTERKHVILKVDSGPGRMNIDVLAKLRLQGFYVVPGAPNTTGKTQETDQNYGPFKGSCRCNVRVLTQARFEKGMTIHVTDLPLLVFGGNCPQTGIALRDSFSDAFSLEANLACWRKCGAAPLTRLPLQSNEVRREIATGDAAAMVEGDDEDPEVEKLRRIEQLNHFCCDVLSSHGHDSNQLKRNAPKRVTCVAVTAPQSDARVEAI